jgi:uncharacterized protein YjbI with pentapeptide repeats
MYLHYNFLEGAIPVEMSSLASLYNLDLDNNLLTGTLPSFIFKLSLLVDVSNNLLSRPLPEFPFCFFGNILDGFILSHNSFTGTIPSSIGCRSSLQFFSLGHNQLSRAVAEALWDLPNLLLTDLQNNQLAGPIFSKIVEYNASLVGLNLASNFFSGTIGRETKHLSPLVSLVLSNNAFTGSIPSELGLLSHAGVIHLNDN